MERTASQPSPRRVDLGISPWTGALLGALWTFAAAGVAALGEVVASFSNPVFELFEWVSRVLPGAVLTFGIEHLIALLRGLGVESTAAAAKTAEKAMAVGLAVAIGAVVGFVIAAATRGLRRSALRIGVLIGVVLGAVFFLVVIRGGGAALLRSVVQLGVWGGVLGAAIGAASRAGFGPMANRRDRRRAVALLAAGGAALGAVAFGLSRWLGASKSRRAVRLEPGETSGPAASPPQSALAGRIAPVPGTRPELTTNEDFYRVDINLSPPSIEAAKWRLEIKGLVVKPRVLTLDELRARPPVSQLITLECISNPVGGDLISTSLWTGIRIGELLDDLGLGSGASHVVFEAADGFYESASLEELRDPRSLLVYEMNREPLPEEHGFPLRLYMPNRHGMKLPKWIQTMEVVDRARPGYWVERGWSREAIPHTTSVIDTIRATGSGEAKRISIGGIAYAGARGISKVEVQLDGGPWQEATLRTPALGPLTWVQWRIDLPYHSGRVEARVRAYDGSGAPQEAAAHAAHPDGATGIDSMTARV